MTTSSTKDRFGIRASPKKACKRDRLVLRGALIAFRRIGEAADLHVDGVAKAQSLIAKVADEFGLEILDWTVDVANGFQE